jgi:hypothetical protein
MRRVGHEVPLRLKRRLQPAEQVVQGVAQLRELVVAPAQSQPAIVRSGRSSRPAISQPSTIAIRTLTRKMTAASTSKVRPLGRFAAA